MATTVRVPVCLGTVRAEIEVTLRALEDVLISIDLAVRDDLDATNRHLETMLHDSAQQVAVAAHERDNEIGVVMALVTRVCDPETNTEYPERVRAVRHAGEALTRVDAEYRARHANIVEVYKENIGRVLHNYNGRNGDTTTAALVQVAELMRRLADAVENVVETSFSPYVVETTPVRLSYGELNPPIVPRCCDQVGTPDCCTNHDNH